jgi:protease-4
MPEKKRGVLRRVLGAFWNAVTRVRLALSNLLFLTVLVLLFFLFSGGAPQPLPERAALLLNPVGRIVEQKSYVDPVQLLFGQQAPQEREVLLRDVLDAIEYARDDERITALVMQLDLLFGAGISKTREIAEALEDFRQSGKPIIASGDGYTQGQYLLAAQADTIIMHPLGAVALEGFSNYQWYFREALEKLNVSMHVFKAGDHKSAAEPYLRNDMSPGEREISQRWLNTLWRDYTGNVEQRRQLAAGSVDLYIEQMLQHLEDTDGDLARVAVDVGLVDQLQDAWQTNAWLVSEVGAADEEGYFEAVQFEDYLQRKKMRLATALENMGERVAVVTAQGMILDGEQPAGSIGGDSLARLLRMTVDDDMVRALVLRVDSGGGSAFASEVIRQQVLYARSLGKPVVVSMGSIAASGGYWIAAPADEIWAQPTTITGSIGVFAAFPTLERLFQRFGLHTDGTGTTSLAGSLRVDRPLNPTVSAAVQASVDHLYQRFIALVAEGRNLSPEQVQAIAGGRVWSGEDALEVGLVDELGGLDEAIASAAALAGLDEYEVDYVSPVLSAEERLMRQLLGKTQLARRAVRPDILSGLERLAAPLRSSLEFLSRMNDPRDLYAHCSYCLVP